MRDILTDNESSNLTSLVIDDLGRETVRESQRITHENQRLRERIANASTLRDGGEMFLDLAECER